ncbi:MAG: cell envelope integrity protein CreD [Candidatus Electrothrix sp. AU1_5]|nr:cell envelope integrity protein CreD [Candidatus Electrothrix gigas]
MDVQETVVGKTKTFIRTSATLKIIAIGILVLVLQIPASMISSVMYERESRRNTVVQEINSKWGWSQTVTGPFFTIPFKEFYTDRNKEEKVRIKYFHLLPEQLTITGAVTPHIRYRSLYEAVLYTTQLKVSGRFTVPPLAQLTISPENILWDKALFSIGISDMRGIQEQITVTWNGVTHEVTPGLQTKDIASAGVSSLIPLSPTAGASSSSLNFALQLHLNGSEKISFIPVAEETVVKLTSDWPSPSFNGAFLPATRKVDEQGFSASWKVLHLNRNFPQVWQGNRYKVDEAAFGLKLLITADIYQKSIRISKYALMFIVFTFSAFFFTEIINRKRVHPIQYLLIGLAVTLFYVLLLSISEHLNFNIAYLLSAGAITCLITGYSQGILRNKYFTLTVCALLLILYAYLYIVLQLEDYALLMGALGLFAVLTTVMYLTRKVDWYATGVGGKPAEEE